MVRLGENPGKYTLENVQNGESEVCGKKSCYMNFRQVFNENKLGFPANFSRISSNGLIPGSSIAGRGCAHRSRWRLLLAGSSRSATSLIQHPSRPY
jgi:hypothetical protein